MTVTRRSALALGGSGLAALAGCLSEPGGDEGRDESDGNGGNGEDSTPRAGYAAFFALWDWSGRVGGESFEFENPVGAGEVGHGWEPDQGLTREVADTDVFVYLDSPEFAWAQNVASGLEDDYDDVVALDAMAGLESELLPWGGDHDHGNDSHGHDHDDHDHEEGVTAQHDPHVWADPVLAQEMVGTIAEGLAELDADNAEAYEDNAEEYADRLAAVDDAFEELVADADREVAVLAGHDSFQYVERRYGFELHTPVAASPEESPSASEIAETIEVVDDNGIDAVLYDPFEAPEGEVPPLAETIVENSGATDAAPITPAAGTTAEWAEEDWGWVEQMEEVTLPSLGRALGAE